MKELEHALKRVHIDGVPLTRHQHHVAAELAGWTKSAELGIQISIATVATATKRSVSSVRAAVSSLEAAGVIRRELPERGSKHQTHLFFFDAAIQEAAEKSRPFHGAPVHFKTTEKAKICRPERSQVVDSIEENDKRARQILATPKFGGYIQLDTPPRETGTSMGASPARDESLAALSSPPAPLGGGGACSALEVDRFLKFLAKNEILNLETWCQRRKKSDNQRGGVFNRRDFKTSGSRQIGQIENHLKWVRDQKLEVTMRAKGRLLLVDDLDLEGVDAAEKMGFEGIVIETSPGNFQLLIVANLEEPSHIRQAQRQLALELGGDPGALAAGQLHRLPGSANNKNGNEFITRLNREINGRAFLVFDLVDFIETPSDHNKKHFNSGEEKGPSEREMSLACSMARKSHSHQQIFDAVFAIATARNRQGSIHDYSNRTAKNAIEHIATHSVSTVLRQTIGKR